MWDDLIAAIGARAAADATRTMADVATGRIRPRLTERQLEDSIAALGFAPHPLYAAVLRHVGNGGFGPGYGLLGLAGGAPNEDGSTAVDLYATFRPDDPADGWTGWPDRLLPICNWGCAIHSCVDCSTERGSVWLWEPNAYEGGRPATSAIFGGEMSLEDWFRAWVSGADLWSLSFSGPDA